MSFPDSASSWTVNNLNAINVTYAKNHTRLKIFTDRVKRLSSNLDTLYGERKILIGNNTREYWDFTVKITENQTSEIKEIKEIKEALRRLNDATQNGSSESQRYPIAFVAKAVFIIHRTRLIIKWKRYTYTRRHARARSRMQAVFVKLDEMKKVS